MARNSNRKEQLDAVTTGARTAIFSHGGLFLCGDARLAYLECEGLQLRVIIPAAASRIGGGLCCDAAVYVPDGEVESKVIAGLMKVPEVCMTPKRLPAR